MSIEIFVSEALQQDGAVNKTSLEAINRPVHSLDEPRRVDDD